MDVSAAPGVLKCLRGMSHNWPKAHGSILFGTCQPKSIRTCIAVENFTYPHLQHQISLYKQHMSTEFVPVGVAIPIENGHVPALIESLSKRIITAESKGVFPTQDVVVVAVDNKTETLSTYMHNTENGNLISDVNLVSGLPDHQAMVVHCKAILPINVLYSKDQKEFSNNIGYEVNHHAEMLTKCSFRVSDTNILISDHVDMEGVAMSCNSTCKELLEHHSIEPVSQYKTVELEPLIELTGDAAISGTLASSPVINHDHLPEGENYLKIGVPLDVAVLLPVETKIIKMIKWLVLECKWQLRLQQTQLVKQIQSHSKKKKKVFSTPVPYHFFPSDLQHFITVIYPENAIEEQLAEQRRHLHKLLLLDKDTPYFAKSLRCLFNADKNLSNLIQNPHQYLRKPKEGSKQYIVKGNYCYHHYMQDKFDDNGWGCAYRSLQTIVSWLRHQGYTDKPVPSHKEIQQALVDIDDKPSSFVDSKQWIGSTEVGYVLDHLYGVTSKILFVNSGQELPEKARDLINHFETQGTPIMIGGGVLAHTILGIEFNEDSGHVEFLILDPHYTGEENIKVITEKGWCGWKKPDFWDKNSFYNLCMPQRPKLI